MRPPFPADADPFRFGEPEPARRPDQPYSAGSLGMFLLLASLSVLFAAGMVGYLYVRLLVPGAPPRGFINLPPGLWISTGVLIASAVTIQLARRAAVIGGPVQKLRQSIVLTFMLGVGFLAVQTPSLVVLMNAHHQAAMHNSGLYGLTFFLIVLHAAHVIGGLLPLTALMYWAMQNRLAAAHRPLVRHTATYWHFLDCVWLIMFGVLLLTR